MIAAETQTTPRPGGVLSDMVLSAKKLDAAAYSGFFCFPVNLAFGGNPSTSESNVTLTAPASSLRTPSSTKAFGSFLVVNRRVGMIYRISDFGDIRGFWRMMSGAQKSGISYRVRNYAAPPLAYVQPYIPPVASPPSLNYI